MPEQLRKQNVEEKPVPASTVESKEAKKSPEIVEDLVKVREKLLIQKSHGAVRIAGEFLTGNLTREETKRGIARIPDREPLVKKALERLEQMGFIHWAINPEKKTKVLVVDIKKITERKGRNDRWFQNLGGIFHHKAYGKGNKTDALYEIFRDKNVISQEDLDRKIYKEKPLFYIPESKNHAITPEEIKKTDFHIGLWDVIQKSSTNREFPIKEGRGLTWLETRIALFLFHPRFGDGYRDDKGIFMELALIGCILIGLFYVFMSFNNFFHESWFVPKMKLPFAFPYPRILYRFSLLLMLIAGLLVIFNYALILGALYLILFIALEEDKAASKRTGVVPTIYATPLDKDFRHRPPF